MQMGSVNNSVVVEALGSRYKLRFDDVVIQPSFYRFELEALSLAQAGDKVEAVVNSDGGSLSSGIEIANAIFNCKAEVEGILRSSCHSCGSIIFLACHTHDVGLASEMLLHSGSGGSYGTPTQSIQRAESYKRQVRSLFETVYKGFLSDEELNQMIEDDKEFIFGGEEIVTRLEKMYVYRQQQVDTYSQEVEDAMWNENTRIIDETLAELDISSKEKESFLKVRDLLDNTLMEEDSGSVQQEEVSGDLDTKGMVDFIKEIGDQGELHYYRVDGTLTKDNILFVYSNEDGSLDELLVDESCLDKGDRKAMLYALAFICEKNYSKLSTEKLIQKFISEVIIYIE